MQHTDTSSALTDEVADRCGGITPSKEISLFQSYIELKIERRKTEL